MTMTILEAMAKVQAEVKSVCAPANAYVVQMKQIDTGEGSGIVIARRDEKHDPYIVWRWFTEYFGGERVTTNKTGAILQHGHYVETYEEALKIFDSLKPR
jgi:hypothetical protein